MVSSLLDPTQFSELPNVPREQNTNSSESKVATKRKKKRKSRKQSKVSFKRLKIEYAFQR